MISDRQVKYIVTVDDYKSFSAASRALSISQPTLSMQIKKAEDILGVIIFDREKKPLKVTDKGIFVLKQCRRIQREFDQLAPIKDQENIYAGEYKIGVIPTIAPYLIPLFVQSFEKKYKNVKLFFYERQTDELLQEIKEEKLDFGILATPSGDDQIYEKVLYYEPFNFYLNKNNGLLRFGEIDVKDLESETLYQLEDGHCLRYQTEQICGRLQGKLNDNIVLSGGQLETLINLTKKFGGITLVPELFMHYLNKQEMKYIRPIKGKTLTREVSIITSRFFVHEDISNIVEKEILFNLPENIKSLKKSKVKIVPIKE